MTRSELFFVGRVARPHGIRGELKVLEGEGSSGAWRCAKEVFIGRSPDEARAWRVLQVRGGGRFALMTLEGLETPEAARALANLDVFVSADLLPPPEDGSCYEGSLLGLRVMDRQGRYLGLLEQIFDNGAHEIYVVTDGQREILLPVFEGLVIEVDQQARQMIVDPPPGLPGLPDRY